MVLENSNNDINEHWREAIVVPSSHGQENFDLGSVKCGNIALRNAAMETIGQGEFNGVRSILDKLKPTQGLYA